MHPAEYAGAYDAPPPGLHPGMTASLMSLHPFFPQSRLPEKPLSEDDMALFMLLLTYADALDALPLEATRSFSDLRELDAVLGAHLTSLTQRLQHLAAVLQDPEARPGDRLLALKDVAEEARAYKMGGEDKIRVAVNTADMITSHTDYIDSLLRSLTSIPALGPYIQERRPQYQRLSDLSSHPRHGELTSETPATSHAEPLESGTLARRAGKGRAFAAETAGSSRLGRESEAARAAKKRKLTEPSTSSQRSRHHAEGRAGGSAAQGKPRQGRTYNDDTDQATSDEAPEDGDGDRLVRGAHRARARVGAPGADSKTTTATWSGRRATDGDDEAPRSTVQSRPAKTTQGGSRGDQDDQRYCFCNNVSYGDMIGCDDDDCEREWFHLGCVGLNKPPQGTWYCDACQERRALQARQKAKRGVARSGRAGSATLETVAAVPPRRATGARR